MKIIKGHQIVASNDDYHGGDIPLDAYESETRAKLELEYLNNYPKVCGECGAVESYSLRKVNIFLEDKS